MKFKELMRHLDERFPKGLSNSWDADGVDVCVDWDLEIGRILIALDVTFEVIDYAITHGYNCIISHHPMIYEPIKKLDLSTTAIKKAVALARHNICAAAFHTRLDAVDGGVNDCLINAAGISGDVEALRDTGDNGIPIGRLVTLYEETDIQKFIYGIRESLGGFYKKEFGADADIHISYVAKTKKVKKIGVLAGSGMELEKTAAEMGADSYFTGEGKYHALLEAYDSSDINIITAGHFETEAVVLPFIKQIILEKFPGAFADCFIGGQPDN